MQKNSGRKKTPVQVTASKGKEANYIYIAILCGAIFFLYSGITGNSFTGLDDTTIVKSNYPFLADFKNIPQAFKQGVFKEYDKPDTMVSYYRPVVTLSLMADTHISPTKSTDDISPKPFLRANIFYHALACVILLLLLLELTANPFASFLLSMLFTVHPMLAQAVAWIPGRNDTLAAIFVFASLLFLLRYAKSQKIVHLIVHILLFMAALFTKENAVVLPVLSVLFLLVINRRKIQTKEILTVIAGYIVPIALWFTMRQSALAGNGHGMNAGEMVRNIISNGPLLIQYIGKALIPYRLSVMSTVQDTNYLVGVLAIIALPIGIYFGSKEKRGIMIFGLLWFLLFLVPSFISNFSGLEHRIYLPMAGLFIAVSQIDNILNIPKPGLKLSAAGTILLALIVIFSAITYKRLPIFKDTVAFNTSAMESSPHNVMPCLFLAKHYEESHDYEKAIAAYSEALARDPNTPQIHNNLAGEYIALRNYTEAEKELKMELVNYPSNTFAVFNLGLIYYTYQRDSDALSQWKKALSMDTGFMQPRKMLAEYYLRHNDSTAADPYVKWLRFRGYPL